MKTIALIVLAGFATVASAQSATVNLTHDDADGIIQIGESVTWTLSISFEGFGGEPVADGGNMAINGTLGASSAMAYTETNGGNNGGESNGAGIGYVCWSNSLFLEAFGSGPAGRTNPFVVGTFTGTYANAGATDYTVDLGNTAAAFLRIGTSAFAETAFNSEDVARNIDVLTVEGADCGEMDGIEEGFGIGVDARVNAIVSPSGQQTFAGGEFSLAGGFPASFIAEWTGGPAGAWLPLGVGTSAAVNALALTSTGGLVVGGDFLTAGGLQAPYIATWDGSAWHDLGSAIDGPVLSLHVDDSDNIYAGGFFFGFSAGGLSNIAKWDGSSWNPLGAGTSGPVREILSLPNGDLIVGGSFTSAGGSPAAYVARWDGTNWFPMGSGMNNIVRSLARLPDGRIVAGGDFTSAGGGNAEPYLAVWDGSDWADLGTSGTGPTGPVYALTVNDNADLLAGGTFNELYRWDGEEWSTAIEGPNGAVTTLARSTAGSVLGGGTFDTVGVLPQNNIVLWRSQPPLISAQPQPIETCIGESAQFILGSADDDIVSYQWQAGPADTLGPWQNLSEGFYPEFGTVSGASSDTLTIDQVLGDFAVRCFVANPCREIRSQPAILNVGSFFCCEPIDFNGDGIIDNGDIGAFIEAFLEVDPTADVNGDGVVDNGDISLFIALFLAGCD